MTLEQDVYHRLSTIYPSPIYEVIKTNSHKSVNKWMPDFTVKKRGRLLFALEVKETLSKLPATLDSQLKRAYAVLAKHYVANDCKIRSFLVIPSGLGDRVDKYVDAFATIDSHIVSVERLSRVKKDMHW